MITSLSIKNFRGYNQTKLNLRELTILVGKNNAGKSTLIEALRIASLVTNKIQRQRFVSSPDWLSRDLDCGIMPSIQNLSISSKNIFHLYGEPPATIEIRFQNNIRIVIYIGPDLQIFTQIYNATNECITNSKMLKNEYIPIINILPQISPLLESEDVVTDTTVRTNLFTRLSSRHFRNQIYKYPEYFGEFKNIVEQTWRGLQITEPSFNSKFKGETLSLMVRDTAFTAEVAQMGHGLQMWLQTMWFLSRCDKNSTVILDEPDVYMHADLQRKLIKLIRGMFKQVVIATHSIEIISEVDPDNILPINKDLQVQKFATSEKIVQEVISGIGSILNIDLSRLSYAKRLIFTEGPKEDLDILSIFHSKIFPSSTIYLNTIPHVCVEGWGNWQRVVGGHALLSQNNIGITTYCIFDSDYHTQKERSDRLEEAKSKGISLHIWNKKEIENYLLNAKVISMAINHEAQKNIVTPQDVEEFLMQLCERMIENTKYSFIDALRNQRSISTKSTKELAGIVNSEFQLRNNDYLSIICGKEILKSVLSWSKSVYKISLNKRKLANAFNVDDIPIEIKNVISHIENNEPFL